MKKFKLDWLLLPLLGFAIVLVLWLLGFVARGGSGARWYRW
jgi:hypothetical protein